MGLFPSWASALVSFLDGYTTSLLPLPNVHIKHACVSNPLHCSMPLSPPYESRSAQSHQIYKTNLFRVQKIVKYYSKPLPLNYHSGPMLLITLKGSFLSWLEITFSTPHPPTHTQFKFPILDFTQATVSQWTLISSWEGILLQGYILFSSFLLHFTSSHTVLAPLLAHTCPTQSFSLWFTELLVCAKCQHSEANINIHGSWVSEQSQPFMGSSHIKQEIIIQCAEDCEEAISSWRKSWPSISKGSETASPPSLLYIVGTQ